MSTAMPGGLTDFESTPEIGEVVAEGRQDFSLAQMGWNRSKGSGNIQCVGTFICDNGGSMGLPVTEYFPMEAGGQKMGMGKLKSLGVKSGFPWELKPNMDSFVEQFVDFDEPLRFSALVVHQYNIRSMTGGTDKYDVSKEEFDNWPGEKRIKAVIANGSYGTAANEAEFPVKPSVGIPGEKNDEYEPDSFDSGNNTPPQQQDDSSFEPDDDLPF